MGKFTYESHTATPVEDRALTHLQTVILAKVRRGEAFAFSWSDDMSTGGGRTTVYVHEHSSMVFKYSGSRSPQLNPSWLHILTETANSGRGLHLVSEPSTSVARTHPADSMVFAEVPAHYEAPASSASFERA